MKNSITLLTVVFVIAVATDITGIAANIAILHYFAKPLLLPVLILLLATATPAIAGKRIMLAALVFSWVGDIFLLIEDKNPLFFIFGLASFLTTHILYIIYFLSIRNNQISLLKKQPLLIAVVLVYGIVLVWLLFPTLADLKIPVMVYAAVICTMLLCSLHIFLKVNKPANTFFVLGALLFVLSDSLLAINKFYQPFAFAGVCIMLTYCAAQYFIVTGFIKQQQHD
ncbi:lysoplasmalogenase [Ferruginibacter sp.]|nr:lysoplasmalogenase [Ferruginibacter sp.]